MTLPYDLNLLPRERSKYYISATEDEISQMLKTVGCASFEDLYRHIPKEVLFDKEIDMPESLEYMALKKHLENIADKNIRLLQFTGHGLAVYKIPKVIDEILSLRGLTTPYTPYQPERSQGTLMTQWIYQSCLSQITGFEAINASLYDRATAIFEGILCAKRIKKEKTTALILDSVYKGDKEVLLTMADHTDLNIKFIPSVETEFGKVSLDRLRKNIEKEKDSFCLVYPHVNTLGIIEDVDAITDLAQRFDLLTIVIIDPMRLAHRGLKPPCYFGQRGADIIVGEGQHLALAPNFGGPGLGIFGIRFNEHNKSHIRATAGRFVGKAMDISGRDCKVIVLSTREQHIRREKANSNICSNQAYLATIAGAAILSRGEEGFTKACGVGPNLLRKALKRLLKLKGIKLAFPKGEVFNEVTLKIDKDVATLLKKATKSKLAPGVDVCDEVNQLGHSGQFICLSFSDIHSEENIDTLCNWFEKEFGNNNDNLSYSHLENFFSPLSKSHLREKKVGLPCFGDKDIYSYYHRLAKQNISPDDACYPLGSCTMKYNPYINDYTARLKGFEYSHPEQQDSLSQGNLEIIFKIQEYFKAITGLKGVTTQPVAGAQGELIGLKLFQAYHKSKGESRDIILIPQSAHGTNPATATVAGFISKNKKTVSGIVIVKTKHSGEIDIEDIKKKIFLYGRRISGIMITNPNTSGIFETEFKSISNLIHSVDGLIYMDGANMNAIAGWVDLDALGVDAVHNNTHKTWSIPHGGGGPGDAIVAVNEKLLPFLPGVQIIEKNGRYIRQSCEKSIGSFHRHYGNFAHKVRCYTYLMALGKNGIKHMSAVAVLCARYLYHRLKDHYPILPTQSDSNPRMHEFIITLNEDTFDAIQQEGIPRQQIIARVGKLFLDFGFHAPTVAFPEVYGLMIEPTESYSKKELDRFADAVIEMKKLIDEHPYVLLTVPHFTPIDRVDEVSANKNLVLSEKITKLPNILQNRIDQKKILEMSFQVIKDRILSAHRSQMLKY